MMQLAENLVLFFFFVVFLLHLLYVTFSAFFSLLKLSQGCFFFILLVFTLRLLQ